jgi:hypothetical protein
MCCGDDMILHVRDDHSPESNTITLFQSTISPSFSDYLVITSSSTSFLDLYQYLSWEEALIHNGTQYFFSHIYSGYHVIVYVASSLVLSLF